MSHIDMLFKTNALCPGVEIVGRGGAPSQKFSVADQKHRFINECYFLAE